jgi:hypothetical protein
MWNLASFMQSIKQRFSQWFNGRNNRTGTLWEGRFKSVLVEGADQTLSTVAAYIDLNPVRAGIVRDPADYRWCGYAQALGGGRQACIGLQKVVFGAVVNGKPGEMRRREVKHLLERYRVYLFENGAERRGMGISNGGGGRQGLSAREAEAVVRAGGRISFYHSLRCRVRYFTDGCAIGTLGFVEGVFIRCRERFGPRRASGPRELRGVDFPGLFTVKDLKKRVLIPAEVLSD